ncbi:MAG: hypothetical protein ACT4O1_06755 [Gemmatimonadota bacterium]
MPVDYLAELTAQGKSFTLAHAAGTNPLVHSFTLTPPAGLISPSRDSQPPTLKLSVTDTVVESTVTGTRDLEIDLPIIGKWVRVPTPDLPADPITENPIGGMPAAERLQQLSGTVTGLLSTTLTTDMPPATLMQSDLSQGQTAGVPALLGRIKGVVNETIKELKEVLKTLDPIAVTAALRIRVVDDQSPSSTTTTSLVQVQFGSGTLGALTAAPPAGTALVNANPFTFSLRIPPLFSELRAAEPEVVKLSVYVSLDLSVTPPPAGSAPVTTTIDFPPIPLVLPTIPIPTIVVLCENELFFGRKLVVVPSDSLIGQALSAGGRPVGDALTLTNQMLTALSSVIGGLAGAASFAGFLTSAGGGAAGMTSTSIAATMPAATAAAVLMSIAQSPGQTIIVASSQLSTLDAPNLVFDPGGWFGIGRFTANAMASSLIVIGRPGTTVSFGQFGGWPIAAQLTPLTITLGPGVGCAISSLVPPGATINIQPTDPASKMTIVFGGTVTSFSPKQNQDQISSVAIARPPAGLMLAT